MSQLIGISNQNNFFHHLIVKTNSGPKPTKQKDRTYELRKQSILSKVTAMHTLKLPPKEELTAIFLPGRKATEETPASLYERLNIKVRTNHTFILYLSAAL